MHLEYVCMNRTAKLLAVMFNISEDIAIRKF